MFELESKAIQIDGGKILCQDGSIWEINGDSLEKIAFHKGKARIKKDAKGYTEQFEEFWTTWNGHIRNTCAKIEAYGKWEKLSTQDRLDATAFIPQYGKSSNEHNYLKRANTYLSGKMWENATAISAIASSVIPPMENIAWSKKIYNQDMGITESAREQVTKLGMPKEEAWRLINDV